ncbi:hypothetical protein POSPLADRAFT_1041930 [Postia placenta MAD-698-R-SB12]|uniref:Uncharacterized protein n=1 Tax=Postia placenta MAD-698-R-SB12 TaxID=670580 RepID=A0A1X6MJV1_9APHY|nr:hypothetical protein POSPLADRAFT_1041930 [Postia placenta MAD-698-R-SB12]OSX56721.1 hypothetical protein POSPLADRAFT_1041930 [Postia placenta MAD-698-R-SB12]
MSPNSTDPSYICLRLGDSLTRAPRHKAPRGSCSPSHYFSELKLARFNRCEIAPTCRTTDVAA